MPELPEVETVVRAIRPDVVGHTIHSAWMDWPNCLQTPDPATFLARIQGQTIQQVTRRAKYILLQLSHDWLLIHLKMSGRLYVIPDDQNVRDDQWVHFRFQLENQHQLRFSDARKFGRVYLTPDLDSILGGLGPEPLEERFTLDVFQGQLAQRRGVIKPLLLNQTVIAGVGNIYADEALHYAHIAPLRRAESLQADEIQRLYEGIKLVLTKGIERQGASIGWYRQPNGEPGTMQDDFLAYDREGQACLTCGQGRIRKIVVGQRGTHYCPHCQK
jgi:formamidopyrimidine-DNA glycosylase